MRIDLFIHIDGAVDPRIDTILQALTRIEGKENKMATTLDTLTSDVAAETTVEQSAITLLQGLKASLDAAGTDPAKLAALSTQIESNTAGLAAAITANTPAAS
jgi:hypothetical protein